MESPIRIDVSLLPSATRHDTIFKAYESLDEGQSLVLAVDHDPQPLFYEFSHKYPKSFGWDYLDKGPEKWRVLITRQQSITDKIVADLVMEDLSLGKVFDAYGIDFCCHGDISLEEACRRQKLDINEVLVAMKKKSGPGAFWQPHFEEWSVSLLIQYILENHHSWERHTLSDIEDLTVKVADHHEADFPNLKKVKEIVGHLKYAVINHFQEEEEELFPLILKGSKSVELLKELEKMKLEHTEVGAMLTDLTLLTNNFQPPQQACSSFRLLYSKLGEFKQDILQHIHLENTLLVTKAVA
jgi:regulator of cell morphogenesis and NO signaling